MSDRTVGRSVGNLVLAMLNATLILLALCLWLAWSAFSAAERVSAELAAAVEIVLPLRDEVRTLTLDVAAARRDLAALRETEITAPAGIASLQASIDRMEAQLARLADAIASLESDPGTMIDRAIETTFREAGTIVADAISRMRGVAPGS